LAIKLEGLVASVRRIFQPCFLGVEGGERMSANSAAPATERKLPTIANGRAYPTAAAVAYLDESNFARDF